MGIGKNPDKGVSDNFRCENCNSENLVVDHKRGENLCDDCGLVHSTNLDSSGHVRSGENSHNSRTNELGTNIDDRGAPNSVRRANKKERKKREVYLEDLFSIVDQVIPEGRVRQAVKDLLKSFDDETKLWRLRGKLHGEGGKEYRKRALVVGAIIAVGYNLLPNEGNVIARRWEIDHKDLVKTRKMFRKHLSKLCGPIDKEGAMAKRKEEILNNLERYRDLLAENVGWNRSASVYNEALRELVDQYELIMDGEDDDGCSSPIQNTKYGSKGPEVTAWEAFLVAMVEEEMGASLIRWLERRAAPTAGGNLTKSYARRAAVLADGGEEE